MEFCRKAACLALPVGVGLAVSASNGSTVGLAVGAALAVVFFTRRASGT